MAAHVIVRQPVAAGVIVQAVRLSDRAVVAEVCVLRGRTCYARQLAAAKAAVRRRTVERDGGW